MKKAEIIETVTAGINEIISQLSAMRANSASDEKIDSTIKMYNDFAASLDGYSYDSLKSWFGDFGSKSFKAKAIAIKTAMKLMM